MQKLSPNDQQAIDELAQRHGFSREAVSSMLESVARGNGTMAQFDHAEFGGSGQWMGGGMTMVSDMFNDALKARVAALCSDLAKLVAKDPGSARGTAFSSKGNAQLVTSGGSHSHGGSAQERGDARPAEPASLFVPPASGGSNNWWPEALGTANSTGAQNNVRYAYFAQAKRLAIELHGKVTVYDTLDHAIGSFSQEQSRAGSLSFHSQHGLVDVASLPVVKNA
ncbi:MAG TPA: SHOCT domain-containing protein [Burkholderiales bacterium]|nr:SHOCT domain-containing protein [Burkholderiales bacterium]